MIIGITGTFGSGKTEVSRLFKPYGFKVINADKLYHNIYKKDKTLKTKIKKEFGTTSKDKLKEIVFNNSKKLKKLNSLTHALIKKEIKKNIAKKTIIDAPLLIESGSQDLVDKIIIVKTGKQNCIKRVTKKMKYSKKEIEQIFKSQMTLKQKLKFADFVIDNNKSLTQSGKQVKKIISQLNCKTK